MTGLDFAIVGIMGYGAWRGWRKGLLAIFIDLAGSLLAFFLAARYSAVTVAALDRATGLVGATARALATRFAGSIPAMGAPVPKAGLVNPQIIGALGLPEPVSRLITAGAADALAGPLPAGTNTIGDLIFYQLASTLWLGVVFLAGGFLLGRVMALAGGLASTAMDLTPLMAVNRAGGTVVGLAQAALFAAVAVGFILPVLKLGQAWPPLAGSKLAPILTSGLGWAADLVLAKVL